MTLASTRNQPRSYINQILLKFYSITRFKIKYLIFLILFILLFIFYSLYSQDTSSHASLMGSNHGSSRASSLKSVDTMAVTSYFDIGRKVRKYQGLLLIARILPHYAGSNSLHAQDVSYRSHITLNWLA